MNCNNVGKPRITLLLIDTEFFVILYKNPLFLTYHLSFGT